MKGVFEIRVTEEYDEDIACMPRLSDKENEAAILDILRDAASQVTSVKLLNHEYVE